MEQEIEQEGGKLLDKGVYGCIFQPPLLCKWQRRKPAQKKLGKLAYKWSMGREAEVATYFSGLGAEAARYMILPELDTVCEPRALKDQKEPDLKSCKPVQTFGYDSMIQYEMRYGGKTLYSTIDTMRTPISKLPFFRIMRQILEAGAFCTLHGLVHNDLHAKNILMDKDYKPLLIDFGRSYFARRLTHNLIKELKAEYAPELDQTSPESSMEDGLESGYSLESMLEDIRTKKPSIFYAERFLGLSRQQQIRDLRTFWLSSKAIQRGDWLAFWKMYWPSSDSWGAGSILLWILRKLLFSKEFTESQEWKKMGGLVRAVLREMLRASPRERLDCVEALALYDPGNELVTGDLGSAWLEKRGVQRKQIAAAVAAEL